MTKFLGVLAAAVVGSAMCGAARAGDYCDYQYHYGCGYYDDCHSYYDYYHRDHFEHRARVSWEDCGEFTFRDWMPRHQCYVFWSPSDRSWYYWYSASHSFLPYDQYDAHPATGVVPDMPKGLPPVVVGGADRPPVVVGGNKDKDQMPSVPPDNAPDNVPVPAP